MDKASKNNSKMGKKRRGKRKKGGIPFWLWVIIIITSVIFGLFANQISEFIYSFYQYQDSTYQPKDIERQRHLERQTEE